MSSRSVVSIQKASYDSLDVDALLAPLGGMGAFVHRGQRVLLKVNLLRVSRPEQAVVTDPRLVRRVAESVLRVGGTPFIGDSPAGPFTKGSLTRVYRMAGLFDVSRELGIELNFDTRVEKVPVPGGKRVSMLSVCSFARDADVVVSLPKIKTHNFQILTLAVKNMFGVVSGLSKARLHSTNLRKAAFADMLLDVLGVMPPSVSIVDGVVGMMGEGPGVSGTPVPVGVVLAGVDAVGVDVSVCRLLGVEPMRVPVLRAARVRGLWPGEVVYPLLRPEDVLVRGFVLPKTASQLVAGARWVPRVSERCSGCGACVRVCPAGAMQLRGGRAVVDVSRCVRCYCCDEVCGEGAIVLEEIS